MCIDAVAVEKKSLARAKARDWMDGVRSVAARSGA
jgi:hypothetical protein